MEPKNNAGALFKNDNKTKETQPDYKGNAIINGQPKQISAWINTSAKGLKYMSLTFEEPRDKNEVKTEVKNEPLPAIVNNDLPF
jgi:uncharacterized protein (DUF736 family)